MFINSKLFIHILFQIIAARGIVYQELISYRF